METNSGRCIAPRGWTTARCAAYDR